MVRSGREHVCYLHKMFSQRSLQVSEYTCGKLLNMGKDGVLGKLCTQTLKWAGVRCTGCRCRLMTVTVEEGCKLEFV